MTDRRLYMPRCKTCGPLGWPTSLDSAASICGTHTNKTRHKTGWYPTHARIIVKGKTSDCE